MDHSQKLLQKYLNGQCTPEEKNQLYRYLSQNRAEDYNEVFQQLWAEVAEASNPSPAVSDRMYQSITEKTQINSGRSFRLQPWLIAASLSGLTILLGFLYYFIYNTTEVHQTQFGEIKTLKLPDGSTVHLNANSRLSYSSSLATDQIREVWLTGEAYFEVSRQKNATNQPVKLVVHTNQVDIEVLGTAFNVKDRRGITQVVLDEGKVRLTAPETSTKLLAMAPGESAQVDQQQSVSIQKVMEPAQVSSWKDNELYFNDQPLYEIQEILADNYGLELQFADDELSQLRFTGSTPADDLSVLFTTLEKSFLLDISQNGNQYIIQQSP